MKKVMTLSDLDLRDVTALKGLAITAIVFHNYFHLVNPAHENEFNFDPTRFRLLLDTTLHPSLLVQALFSFFGHFGVQVFIFVSAYGITKKYWDDRRNWTAFMAGRIEKLYPVFGLVVLGWAIGAFTFGGMLFLKRYGLELILMLFAVSNLVPGYGLPPIGPWWFIPFIMQFYALWPLLRKITSRFGRSGLLILSAVALLATYVLNPVLDRRWSVNLLETPVGHMPEICLGIVAARTRISLNATVALLASGIVLLGSIYRTFWLLSFVAALIACLWAYLRVREHLTSYRILEWVGRYSLLIFLINAIVRNNFLGFAWSPYLQLLCGGIIALLSLGISVLIQGLLPPGRSTRHASIWQADNSNISVS